MLQDKQEILGCIDAYVLVFAMDDRESYEHAKQLLISLLAERRLDVPVILVSNKSDLVRRCEVETDGTSTSASTYITILYCNYIYLYI